MAKITAKLSFIYTCGLKDILIFVLRMVVGDRTNICISDFDFNDEK
jgi:hypothetical protein